MLKLTNNERGIIRRYLDEYLQAPYYPIRGNTIARTRMWAHGQTMRQIALQEGVSISNISVSIRALADHVLEFAKDKGEPNVNI